jgi:predicted nuclease of predicted toxin-antitoxin system
MKLLLDECIPWKVKFLFEADDHECHTVRDAGLTGKENGELLTLAENQFDVLVTIDKNIPYQQNMTGRKLSLLIIRPASNDLDDIRPHIPDALAALKSIKPGQVIQVGYGTGA